MKLSIGIVGLPNVGKSTLFKILTKNEVNIANYPFCTIDPNVGVVAVPDERLDALTKLSKSKKTIPAVVEFYDIAGLVKGASKGEGLGNKFLSHIKEVNAIVHVIRIFTSREIMHVHENVDPIRDLEIVESELILKDLDVVERRRQKAEGEARTGNKEAVKILETLHTIEGKLKKGELIIEFRHEPIVKELQLLSAKPQLFFLNGAESDISEELRKKIAERKAEYVVADLKSATDVPTLIVAAYRILNLMSFFTTGEDETRAWTIERGAKAPQAAGVIHTDFEKKFIRAEVVNWKKLVEAAHSTGSTGSPQASSGQGAWAQAKSKGLLRLEGKDYIVQEGDVMEIRHG